MSKNPLWSFEYQLYNPFSYKQGGFARGVGHGATNRDSNEDYWHVSTISICSKNNFERRLGIWPAGFDKDGILYSNKAYGDYPTFLPSQKKNHLNETFSGWMLLNYNKPAQVSSTLGGFLPNYVVNEVYNSEYKPNYSFNDSEGGLVDIWNAIELTIEISFDTDYQCRLKQVKF